MSDIKDNDDTHFGMAYNEFLSICANQGFEVSYKKDYNSDPRFYREGEDNIEEEVILINKEKGLVLYATSSGNKKRLNSAKVYGEVRLINGVPEKEIYEAFGQRGGFALIPGSETICMSLDVRIDFVANLSKLDGKFTFVNPWNTIPRDRTILIWFVNFMEEQEEGYSYIDIAERKMSEMTEEGQRIMGFTPQMKL